MMGVVLVFFLPVLDGVVCGWAVIHLASEGV